MRVVQEGHGLRKERKGTGHAEADERAWRSKRESRSWRMERGEIDGNGESGSGGVLLIG